MFRVLLSAALIVPCQLLSAGPGAFAQVITPPFEEGSEIAIIRLVTVVDQFDFTVGKDQAVTKLGAQADLRVKGKTGDKANAVVVTTTMTALRGRDGADLSGVLITANVPWPANKAFDLEPADFTDKRLTRTFNKPGVKVSEFRRGLDGQEVGCRTELRAQVTGPEAPLIKAIEDQTSFVRHRQGQAAPVSARNTASTKVGIDITAHDVTDRFATGTPLSSLEAGIRPMSFDLDTNVTKSAGVGPLGVKMIGKVHYSDPSFEQGGTAVVDILAYFRDDHPQPLSVDVDHWARNVAKASTRAGELGAVTAVAVWEVEVNGNFTEGEGSAQTITPVFAVNGVFQAAFVVPKGN